MEKRKQERKQFYDSERIDAQPNKLWVIMPGIKNVGGPFFIAVAAYPKTFYVPSFPWRSITWHNSLDGQRIPTPRKVYSELEAHDVPNHVQLIIRYLPLGQINRSGLIPSLSRAMELAIYEFCYTYGYSPRQVTVAHQNLWTSITHPLSLNLEVDEKPSFYRWFPWLVCLINLEDHAKAWQRYYEFYGVSRSPRLTPFHKQQLVCYGPNEYVHRFESLYIPDWHAQDIKKGSHYAIVRAFQFVFLPEWWCLTFPSKPYLPKSAKYFKSIRTIISSARYTMRWWAATRNITVKQWVKQRTDLTPIERACLYKFIQQPLESYEPEEYYKWIKTMYPM